MNNNTTSSLIELREYYQSLLAQYDQASAHAKAQLAHVEALLLEALLPTPELITHNTTLIADQTAPPKAITPHPESAPAPAIPANPSRKPSKPGKAIKPLQEESTSDQAPLAAVEPTPTETIQGDTDIPVNPNPASKGKEKAPKSESTPAKAPSTRRRGTDMVLDLPPEYEGLRKIDAVALILERNPGNPMHIDSIIDKLYGTLPEDVYKAEKIRMSNVMARGIKDNLWKRAIKLGCYIVPVAEPQSTPTEAAPKSPARDSKPRNSQSGGANKRSSKAPASRKV